MKKMKTKQLNVNFYEIIDHLQYENDYKNIMEHAISETLLANLDIASSKLNLLKEIISFEIPHDMPNDKYRMLAYHESYEIGDEWLINGQWEVLDRVGEDNYVCMQGVFFRRRI